MCCTGQGGESATTVPNHFTRKKTVCLPSHTVLARLSLSPKRGGLCNVVYYSSTVTAGLPLSKIYFNGLCCCFQFAHVVF